MVDFVSRAKQNKFDATRQENSERTPDRKSFPFQAKQTNADELKMSVVLSTFQLRCVNFGTNLDPAA
jgi:hypothetical protein